jgi:alpha-beta hydrolase superfamily lysophospholipase
LIERFSKLPASLAEKSRTVRLAPQRLSGGIPALMVHPDWISPAPTVLWMHGRTAYKELDSGRYLRWVKAGIAAVAIDLPGHGERLDERGEAASHTMDVLGELIGEIDVVVDALADPVWQGVFDLDRMGIGGMSMGGMAALRRLCEPHEFRCAAVECTSGDLDGLYHPEHGSKPWGLVYPPEKTRPLDPMQNLAGFAPVPLLALHSEADAIVPWRVQEGFLKRLRERYVAMGAEAGLVEHKTWATTGAPEEHSGFGRVSNEAKNVQTEFLVRWLGRR